MKQEEGLESEKVKRISIDWGRQGGMILGYIVVFLGYYGIIVNITMIDYLGQWISFVDLDRTVLFWTFNTYLSSFIDPTLFILFLLAIMSLIIVFSIIDWHSLLAILILIPIFIVFISDLIWNLFNIMNVISTGNLYLSVTSFSIILLFFISFGLTYKEDIPEYGIKASIWMVPLIVVLGFFFYTLMFGFSIEALILQFGSWQGYINILILILTVVAGSLSGMKIKKEVIKKRDLEL